ANFRIILVRRSSHAMKRAIIALSIVGLIAPPAYADGVDLVSYFTRVARGTHSAYYIAATIVALMAANYVLNFVVIGLPAVRFGSVPVAPAASGLIALTLLGQVADRVGALFAALLALPVTAIFSAIFGLSGEGAWFVPLLLLNFLLSGFAIAALALYFLRR